MTKEERESWYAMYYALIGARGLIRLVLDRTYEPVAATLQEINRALKLAERPEK